MAKRNREKLNAGWLALIITMALIDLGLFIRYLLRGKNIAILNPKGFVAEQQYSLMTFTVFVLLTIAIPSLILCYFIAWKYRESNTKATHSPSANHSKLLVSSMWLVPAAFMFLLAVVMWSATHRLVPQNTIVSDTKPITIQVISMRWKWLFIYPEQNIASVNYVQIPINTPVTFEITADESPMSSFWIPNLGGQLYAMTSHVNRLNLMAETPGDYPGSSAELNGAGFSGMKFIARASNVEDFNLWVQEARNSPDILGSDTYADLLLPSEDNPIALFSAFERNLYDGVVIKYLGHDSGHGDNE